MGVQLVHLRDMESKVKELILKHIFPKVNPRLNVYLLVQGHIALLVHLVLSVPAAGSFTGAKLDVDVSLTEDEQTFGREVTNLLHQVTRNIRIMLRVNLT